MRVNTVRTVISKRPSIRENEGADVANDQISSRNRHPCRASAIVDRAESRG